MGKVYERIDGRLREFVEAQPMFFVATAPLAGDGHVNLSPKGGADTFAVFDELTVAYLDLGGSHAETIAHLRENGRITLMWCAFAGAPKIVRVHGRGEAVFRDDTRFPGLLARFAKPSQPSVRAVIVVTAEKISDSCGYKVPFLEHVGDRALHGEYFGRKSEDEFAAYCASKEFNGVSIDGLPGLPLPLPVLPSPAPDGQPAVGAVATGLADQ
ncbi:pyridoxamine 5'-phosphate oxidase family protein [Frankia sp. CNm7]|uniref:Pyridoxamine 5'-phosphate oxidase family protein n=1 Tax=Frankia nepalensis TaxID=1836974 RepID=A0A937RHR5_9ACTN|nr:pyridoxamine 5'-phosphate oxidase family protein [Frankia nepalensis]MBL7499353.1 pyridoxamine 5'-phosphate oxidase family protein [Frankia nepalensis]MBL7514111.1 pyridoxamine 5'-phosphate oxidase family protein [Frankia nepalensis]MBL7519916.1 pyridoxamine 5'-phosphate oxidase family protein [Frankia nepalensis]MBL7632466.1 pyridoxamine 5'-phosphate oxidase family protein [Frankia nepalensis]